MLSRLWRLFINILNAIINFSKKDPLVFTLVLCAVIIGGIFATYESLHLTSEPSFCEPCHPMKETGPLSENHTWEMSAHAAAGVKCLDCHGEPGFTGYFKAKMGGLKDLYGEIVYSKEHKLEILEKGAADKEYAQKLVPSTTCLFCHSAQINNETRESKVISIGLNFRKIDNVRNPEFMDSYRRADVLTGQVSTAVDPKHMTHLESGLQCVDCHMGVAHKGEFHNLPTMKSCFDCHEDKRKAEPKMKAPKPADCQTCHVGQVAAQKGTLAEKEGVHGTEWFMSDLECGDCHMTAFDRPEADSCIRCHDQKYADLVAGTQSAYTARLATLKTEWLKLAEERGHMKSGQEDLLNKLGYFVRILERDGSKGIHNPDFFFEVFRAAEELPEAIANYKEVAKKPAGEPGEDVLAHEAKYAKTAKTEAAPAAEKVEADDWMMPKVINLANAFELDAKKPAVKFKHMDHAEKLECESCHTDQVSFGLKFEIEKKTGMKNDFHEKMCFPCHTENNVKVGKTCNKCHVK